MNKISVLAVLTLLISLSVHGSELSLGDNDLESLFWTGRKIGQACIVRENGKPVLEIPHAQSIMTCVSFQMPGNSQGRCYLLTVRAKGNTAAAQIMLSEGFLWGSSQPVRRFIRRRLAADNEYAAYEIPFRVDALPFYVNFGIYSQKPGEMHVSKVTLAEIPEEKFQEEWKKNKESLEERK